MCHQHAVITNHYQASKVQLIYIGKLQVGQSSTCGLYNREQRVAVEVSRHYAKLVQVGNFGENSKIRQF